MQGTQGNINQYLHCVVISVQKYWIVLLHETAKEGEILFKTETHMNIHVTTQHFGAHVDHSTEHQALELRESQLVASPGRVQEVARN